MGWREYTLSLIDLETLYKMVLGGTVALMAIFILFLVYILSVGIDRHIDQTYQQKIEHI